MERETDPTASSLEEAVNQLDRASATKKCRPCGCFHDTLKALGETLPGNTRLVRLESSVRRGKAAITERKYDCLGCEVCYPALAINALNESGANLEIDPCPAGLPEPRTGWPPLPGDYIVLRYGAPVAVCTLHDDQLLRLLAKSGENGVSLIGTLHTENLGIERILTNVAANPNIRFLILCGADSQQVIGHLPGQSLLSLGRSGVDEGMRIIGAKGKRPALKNIARGLVEHFQRSVELVDLIGMNRPEEILRAVRSCVARDPGPVEPISTLPVPRPVKGYLPPRMMSDPAGYFVVYVDRARGWLSLEHYKNNGLLDTVIEGRSAPELYTPAIEVELVSRLDHAAYLGRELARAEAALVTGTEYIQDGAPEGGLSRENTAECGCGDAGNGDSPENA